MDKDILKKIFHLNTSNNNCTGSINNDTVAYVAYPANTITYPSETGTDWYGSYKTTAQLDPEELTIRVVENGYEVTARGKIYIFPERAKMIEWIGEHLALTGDERQTIKGLSDDSPTPDKYADSSWTTTATNSTIYKA